MLVFSLLGYGSQLLYCTVLGCIYNKMSHHKHLNINYITIHMLWLMSLHVTLEQHIFVIIINSSASNLLICWYHCLSKNNIKKQKIIFVQCLVRRDIYSTFCCIFLPIYEPSRQIYVGLEFLQFASVWFVILLIHLSIFILCCGLFVKRCW
jgi:hypothetical protein